MGRDDETICRATNAPASAIEGMGIVHRCFDVALPQQIRDGSNIRAAFEQVRGKGRVEHLAVRLFDDSSLEPYRLARHVASHIRKAVTLFFLCRNCSFSAWALLFTREFPRNSNGTQSSRSQCRGFLNKGGKMSRNFRLEFWRMLEEGGHKEVIWVHMRISKCF